MSSLLEYSVILSSFDDFGIDRNIAESIGEADEVEVEGVGTENVLEPVGFVLVVVPCTVVVVSFLGDERFGSVRIGEGSPSAVTGEDVCKVKFIIFRLKMLSVLKEKCACVN